MSEISWGVDLFGDPILIRDAKRGRPEHVRTDEKAGKVSLLFAMGRSVKEVALALGITQPTLRKHYFSEVEQREAMLLRLEGDQLMRLYDEAKDGSVPAIKELLARCDRQQIARLAADLPAKRSAPVEKKGKKAQALDDARSQSGLYAAREAPPQLVN